MSLFPERDAGIPLSTMVKFNRLKQLTEDQALIAEALKKSSTGIVEVVTWHAVVTMLHFPVVTFKVLQVSSCSEKIRRHPDNPLPEITKESLQDSKKRTVYAVSAAFDLLGLSI